MFINSVGITICIVTKQERRKSTTALMVSLLCSDMLFGAVLIPVRVIDIWFVKSDVFLYIYAYILFLSAFNALFLSFDRYASVIKPLWRRLVETRTIIKGLLITWVVPGVLSLLPISWTHATGYSSQATNIYRYLLLTLLCAILVSIVILQGLVFVGLVKYWTASKRKNFPLRRSHSGGCNPAKEFKKKLCTCSLFVCLITTSVVTWLPTIVYNIMPFPHLSTISLFALLVNAVCDPLLIISFNVRSLRRRRAERRKSQTSARTNMLLKNAKSCEKERRKTSLAESTF